MIPRHSDWAKNLHTMITKTLPFLLLATCFLTTALPAQQGLLGEYFDGKNFEKKVLTRTDAQINFVWDNVAPAPGIDAHVFSVRWTTKIQTPETGTYVFRAHVDDGIRVKVNGQTVIDAWGLHDSERVSGQIHLEANRQYDLQVEYFNALFEGEIQLYWQLPSEKPVFGGLLGYNDHLIDKRFFSLPTPPPTNVTPPKPAPKPPKKPAVPAPAPPQQPKPKPAPVAKDTLEKYLPKNVLFVKSKSTMLPESEPELDRLAGFLLRNPKYRLSIEGHTDHVGDSAKNLILSEERAQTVAAYLIQKGIDGQRITAKGYGDTRPLVLDPAGKPNPKNRRVEFEIQE